jgi:hypothetical protein
VTRHTNTIGNQEQHAESPSERERRRIGPEWNACGPFDRHAGSDGQRNSGGQAEEEDTFLAAPSEIADGLHQLPDVKIEERESDDDARYGLEGFSRHEDQRLR